MKIILLIVALSASLLAITYEGCGPSKKDALFELSGNIKSSIKNDFSQSTTVHDNGTDENVETKISSYINTSVNLSLVNIVYKNKSDSEVCAFVEKEDQTKNTQTMLEVALLYDEKNLPENIDKKIQQLTMWIENINQLGFLLPVFIEDFKKPQETLNKKEKIFNDLYSDSISKSNSLIFMSCAKDNNLAKIGLNKLLFKDKTKEEQKSFFDSITSIFTGDEPLMIDLFKDQITYVIKEQQACAFIKKEFLLNIANNMSADVARFSESSLDKEPKKRYKQIDNYFEHLNVTKALLELYPQNFNSNNFSKIENVRELLSTIKKTTYPQFVLFNIKGAEDISIKLDNKIVNNNDKIYTPHGEHTYSIVTKQKCPVSDTFSTKQFEDKTVYEDFTKLNYPSVFFMTDEGSNIIVDGRPVKANVLTPIEKCSGEVRYVVTFAGQSRDGMIDMEPGETNSIELHFLTTQELSVFNDAKTKNFKTTTATKYSESLTPIASEKLEFSISEKPSHGELTLHERGSFKYLSDDKFVGVDSFEYIIKTKDKNSAPKVVNITVEPSIIPKAIVQAIIKDINTTADEKIEDKKIEDVKKEITEKTQEELQKEEEKYQKFKTYVDSQEQNIEKLKKLQQKYPDMFNRLLKEKIAQ